MGFFAKLKVLFGGHGHAHGGDCCHAPQGHTHASGHVCSSDGCAPESCDAEKTDVEKTECCGGTK